MGEWLKRHKDSLEFLLMFVLGSVAAFAPTAWRLFAMFIAMVVGIGIGELFEEAEPQARATFVEMVRDRAS